MVENPGSETSGETRQRSQEVAQQGQQKASEYAEQGPITGERPGPARLHDLQRRLFGTVDQSIPHRSFAIFVEDLYNLVAVPLHAHYPGGSIRSDPMHRSPNLYIFKVRHSNTLAKERTTGSAVLMIRPYPRTLLKV